MGSVPATMMAWTKTRPEVGGFTLEEHAVPNPGPGEVLVQTQSTSVCGTDLHIWKWDDWSRENVPLGTVTGHETSGRIVALGEGVSSHAIGDHVAIECHLACWQCPRCKEGNAHVCENGSIFGVHGHGAFAPYFVIPAINARHVPEGLVQVVGCFARVCKLDLAARAPVGPECEASSAPESSRNASVCSLPTLPARDVQESHSHTGNLHSVPASPCPAVCTGSVQRV